MAHATQASPPVSSNKTPKNKKPKKAKLGFLFYLNRDKYLYLLLLPFLIFLVVFKYTPMYGITIAFKEYNIFKGIFKSPWVGLDVFKRVFTEDFFWIAVKNTLVLNILSLITTFPLTILLSLMLNEVRQASFKRVSQSLLYLPHFVSWVVVAGIAMNIFSVRNGSINNILTSVFGLNSPIPFLIDENWWIFTYIICNLWKEIGWGTIIYLAALSGVDEELYEAAYIDGASKLRRIWHITLPAIKPTVVIMFILSVSRMLSIGLDAPLLLGNTKVMNVSEVLSTYVYKIGLEKVQYSFATAVGLFQSVINIMMLGLGQLLAKGMDEDGLF